MNKALTELFRGLKYHHVSYITNDYDKAIKRLESDYGWSGFRDLGVGSFPNATGGTVSTHIGLGCVAPGFVELHHPQEDPGGLYTHVLSDSPQFQLAWHHVAFSVPSRETLKAVKETLIARGLEIAAEGGEPLPFIYADTRPETGHYTEYFVMTPQLEDMFGQIRADSDR